MREVVKVEFEVEGRTEVIPYAADSSRTFFLLKDGTRKEVRISQLRKGDVVACVLTKVLDEVEKAERILGRFYKARLREKLVNMQRFEAFHEAVREVRRRVIEQDLESSFDTIMTKKYGSKLKNAFFDSAYWENTPSPLQEDYTPYCPFDFGDIGRFVKTAEKLRLGSGLAEYLHPVKKLSTNDANNLSIYKGMLISWGENNRRITNSWARQIRNEGNDSKKRMGGRINRNAYDLSEDLPFFYHGIREITRKLKLRDAVVPGIITKIIVGTSSEEEEDTSPEQFSAQMKFKPLTSKQQSPILPTLRTVLMGVDTNKPIITVSMNEITFSGAFAFPAPFEVRVKAKNECAIHVEPSEGIDVVLKKAGKNLLAGTISCTKNGFLEIIASQGRTRSRKIFEIKPKELLPELAHKGNWILHPGRKLTLNVLSASPYSFNPPRDIGYMISPSSVVNGNPGRAQHDYYLLPLQDKITIPSCKIFTPTLNFTVKSQQFNPEDVPVKFVLDQKILENYLQSGYQEIYLLAINAYLMFFSNNYLASVINVIRCLRAIINSYNNELLSNESLASLIELIQGIKEVCIEPSQDKQRLALELCNQMERGFRGIMDASRKG